MEKFSYEANGYNRGEVNNFVKEVIKETEDIINKLNEQDITIENLKKELEAEKNNKRTINALKETWITRHRQEYSVTD